MMLLTAAGLLFGALFGMVLASYGCVIGERGFAAAASGRSRCVCGRQLSAYENVPVAGWLAARGKARCCGAAIPTRYLWCELFGAAAGASAGAAAVSVAWPGAAGAVAFGAASAIVVPAAVCRTVGP